MTLVGAKRTTSSETPFKLVVMTFCMGISSPTMLANVSLIKIGGAGGFSRKV